MTFYEITIKKARKEFAGLYGYWCHLLQYSNINLSTHILETFSVVAAKSRMIQ